MKNIGLKLLVLTTLFLSGCQSNRGTSSSSDKTPTSSETSSSISPFDSSDSEGGGEEVENKIKLLSGDYLKSYKANERLYLSLHEDANYIILDSSSHIVYTAGDIQKGNGGLNKAYYSSSFSPSIDGDTLLVPQNHVAYNLSKEGYKKVLSAISKNKVKYDDLSIWNDKNNPYPIADYEIDVAKDPTNLKNKEVFRLSSLYDDFEESGLSLYKMVAPYDDNYQLSCPDCRNIEIYDAEQKLIVSGPHSLQVELERDQVIFLAIYGEAGAFFNLNVKLEQHFVELPYEVLKQDDLSTYDVNGDKTIDPLESQDLKVIKRYDNRALYVNCNNPEALNTEFLNKVLTRQDVSDKDVFFTFEHNNKTDRTFYYAYRVTNTGDTDIYVTVKNLGLHLAGSGCWLGEDEWIKFYNVKFDAHMNQLTDKQRSNFDAYVGFSGKYESANRQPITYRVPKGCYIYVMGGTTADSYQKINVFESADLKVNSTPDLTSGCSNGAVLFSVRGGSALGQFMAYRDKDASGINKTPYVLEDRETGYIAGDTTFGAQYVGYDYCHGVVDTNLTYFFNDLTPAGNLKVNYENPYFTSNRSGTKYTPVTGMVTKTFEDASTWVTHINPNSTANAVGTDMTKYITHDYYDYSDICIDYMHYDGRGSVANIGNWMVDYIDTLTFVNQGDTVRKITYRMSHSGVILTFIRDAEGFIDGSYEPTYNVAIASSTYGDSIYKYFQYEIEIPAHSVVRISVDYNLLANSNGFISHTLNLK